MHPSQMAQQRIVAPEGTYHVMSRGNYRSVIFPDSEHAQRWLQLLTRVAAKRRWTVIDWCLMPNHFHLLVKLADGGLSIGMQELNGCYSRWSNAIHDRTGTGHLVRNRFKSLPVTDDQYLLQLLRYLPRNPIAAQLTVSLEAWPWSGYRAIAGLEHPQPFHRPAEALCLFSHSPAEAQRRYMIHVATNQVQSGPDPWSDHED